MRRVILFVVDGCTSRVLGPALERGELPTLAALADRGSLDLDCVSIFPSITPAATASIVTGRYPAAHGIAGMSWWNPETGDVSYFGDDVGTILQRGVSDYLHGFLLRLNGERLLAPTLFQLVERQRRRAACFNHLIFRGDVPHEVQLPMLLRLLPSTSGSLIVSGPSWLCLGDFVSSTGKPLDVEGNGGPFDRFGLDDEGTEAFLRDVPGVEALPDFTVAYFADYDFDSHAEGPGGALETLRAADARLARIFDHWGGLDRVLSDTYVLLTADHSHSDMRRDETAGISLDDLLGDYRRADPTGGWEDDEELLCCPNMRAAEIYLRRLAPDAVGRVCTSLLREQRIDQVIWRESHGDLDVLHVATGDRGEVRFRRVHDGGRAVADEYGGLWTIDGDLGALDAAVEDGHIRYGAYPNALERIANGVEHPRAGRIWVTAHPGFEFRAPGQSVHGRGGSHGTLHALDSLVPLLMAGPDRSPRLPQPSRIVDVAPICAAYLDLPFETRPGDSHVATNGGR